MSNNTLTSIVWFRNDLRLQDNPALLAASIRSGRQIPVFIWDPEAEGAWEPGAASRSWLLRSLERLSEELLKVGSRLVIRAGDSLSVLKSLAEATGSSMVFWNRRYEPGLFERDRRIEAALRAEGIAVETFNASLIHEPEALKNAEGKPFKVFTHFWTQLCSRGEAPLPVWRPDGLSLPEQDIESLPPGALRLESHNNAEWVSQSGFTPGEAGAQSRLAQFIETGLKDYASGRDYPDHPGVSMLSPHLHFGEISPRQIWHAVQQAAVGLPERSNVEAYLRELGWREFAHYILFHFPLTTELPLRKQFSTFPWSDNEELLRRWQMGYTGVPIVDAGMRQLWQTGWMHNRVRMIVASYLTKDLLISWTHGARWFWDALFDADLANNSFGWQWSAGCGADAAPYFRIFNPVLQGEKFDGKGDYVRRWVGEIAGLPAEWIHKPWKAPAPILAAANVELGQSYPYPAVDHALARKRALEALSQSRDQLPASSDSIPMALSALRRL